MSAKSDAGRIGVWGRSGSGKSSYVKKQIKARKRLIIFDPMDEYTKALPGLVRVEHTRRDALELVRQAMAANWSGFRIAYVPPAGKEPAALSALSRLLMAAQKPFQEGRRGAKGITLVVEEMNQCFPLRGGVEKAPGFADICSRGRHFGIEVFGLSQRIAEVSTRFRGNCDETVVLAQKGPRDMDAAAAEIGRARQTVEGLARLHYLHEKDGVVKAGKL